MNGWGTSFDNDANWTQNYQWGSPVSTEGGGGAHNNMPPYITLNYLIKT